MALRDLDALEHLRGQRPDELAPSSLVADRLAREVGAGADDLGGRHRCRSSVRHGASTSEMCVPPSDELLTTTGPRPRRAARPCSASAVFSDPPAPSGSPSWPSASARARRRRTRARSRPLRLVGLRAARRRWPTRPDVAGREPGHLQRHPHRPLDALALAVQRPTPSAVAGDAVAGELAVDARAARRGRAGALDHDRDPGLGDREAARATRARGSRRRRCR